MKARALASERKYRTIFDSAGFAAWESDWSETMRIALASVPDGQQLGTWLESHPGVTQQAIGAAVIRDAWGERRDRLIKRGAAGCPSISIAYR